MQKIYKRTHHEKVPIVLQLYNDRPEILLMLKKDNKSNQTIILRIWQSNIKVKNFSNNLLIGTINYCNLSEKILTTRKKDHKFNGAIDTIIADIGN